MILIILCVLVALNIAIEVIAWRKLLKIFSEDGLFYLAWNKINRAAKEENFDCPPFPQDDDKANIGDPALQPTIQEQQKTMDSIKRVKEWLIDGSRRGVGLPTEDIERVTDVAEKKTRPFNG